MDIIKNAKRIVIKIGTNVLKNDEGKISPARMYSFIEDISKLHDEGKEIIVVTSGAVGFGALKTGISPSNNIVLKQMCAAIGQTELMSVYESGFNAYGITCAQVLLTENDFSDKTGRISLSNVLNGLLKHGIIPVINQNDTVSVNELEEKADYFKVCFSDNDKLSALVASRTEADLLVTLSDIDGLFTDNPKQNPDAKKIKVVEKITAETEKYAGNASKGGRGGMKTKLEGAKTVTQAGGAVIIANGKIHGIINKIFSGEDVGTVFLPEEKPMPERKRGIFYETNVTGRITVNEGAKKALLFENASLLPVGITRVEGDFSCGETVSVVDETGHEFAKGTVNYGAYECERLSGHRFEEITDIPGYKNRNAVISRDNLVIENNGEL